MSWQRISIKNIGGTTPIPLIPGTLLTAIITEMLELDGLDDLADDLVEMPSDREQRSVSKGGDPMYDSTCLYLRTPKEDLFRIIVDIDDDPPAVVSAYGTSRISRYLRPI